MLKRLIIITLLLVLNQFAFAQLKNVYSNLNWVIDDIEGFGYSSDIGVLLRFEPQTFYTTNFPLDSNAYSRIKYDLGGNSNQLFRASLARPFSDRVYFIANLDRYSYPGWMNSSFSRGTDIDMRLVYSGNGLQNSFSFAISNFDREMNGGLVNSDYSISGSTDEFNSLTSDVWFENAYNRGSLTAVDNDFSYEILRDSTIALSVEIENELSTERYRFQQLDGVADYYTQLNVNTIGSINDSCALTKFRNAVFFKTDVQTDTIRKLSVRFGVMSYYYDLNSNNRSIFGFNSSAMASVTYENQTSHVDVVGQYYFQGITQSDFIICANYFSSILHDTSKSKLDLVANVLLKSNSPSFVYSNYYSELMSINKNLHNITKFTSYLGIKFMRSNAFVQPGIGYENLYNWVYIDDQYNVIQHGSELQLIAPKLQLGFESEIIYFKARGSYQYHKKSKVYSLPEWVIDGSAGFRFPVFNKRIFLKSGIEGWYFSTYYARGYVPFLDVMYVQNTRKYGSYLQLNPFITANIQTVDVSFKMINATYGLIDDNPIVGPGFSSIPRFFQFTVDWKFLN